MPKRSVIVLSKETLNAAKTVRCPKNAHILVTLETKNYEKPAKIS